MKIEKRRAVLTLLKGDGETIDEEVWVFPSAMPKAEASDISREMFDDLYDFLNFTVHGLPEP